MKTENHSQSQINCIVFSNKGDVTGYTGEINREALVTDDGSPYCLFNDKKIKPETLACLKRLSEGETGTVKINDTYFFMNSDACCSDTSVIVSVLKDKSKNISGLIMINHNDKTSYLKEQLKIQENQLESFVYSISHDLKSPLLTVEGMVDLVMSDTDNHLSDKSSLMMERLKANTEKATRMINDLLELSRVGRVDNTAEPLNLKITFRQIASCIEGKNRFGRINTVFEGDEVSIHFPLKRLAQLFKAVLDNAVKALKDTPQGTINVSIKNNGASALVSVTDNGIGIESVNLDEIFLPFRRLPAFKDFQGTGMGLPLSKAIVEKNGGKMWIESSPGEGTTVYFTILLPPSGNAFNA